MAQNVNKVGVMQKSTKLLQDLATFIISPWLDKVSVKSLQKRIDYLERNLYEDFSNTEQRLELLIQQLQHQFNFLQDSTKNQLDNLLEHDLRQQVLDVVKEQTDLMIQNMKPIVEDLIRERQENKRSQENISQAHIQVKQHKLQEFLAHIQPLSPSLTPPEEQSAACLEAGFWLLAHREEIAQQVANELLSEQHPQIEIFRYNLGRYLKLLGSCLENKIEPRLLYQGIITHHQPPIEAYMKAIKLIQQEYVRYWEDSVQVSTEAAKELKVYFKYLIDYLVKISL
ncbi:hypothetical protein [Brasilonema sp. UFV-L1]|uniref:hypothetical protein n=1 Tax=Brasilonema sp. UFV-L1 TaxID=2234130 RepID=UPI00145D5556|nr:hypothetical protein [Brasilonema sp. UFV-L1]NMG09232.1 hypothetical protein [Brasilonema sp. UFV-L1]